MNADRECRSIEHEGATRVAPLRIDSVAPLNAVGVHNGFALAGPSMGLFGLVVCISGAISAKVTCRASWRWTRTVHTITSHADRGRIAIARHTIEGALPFYRKLTGIRVAVGTEDCPIVTNSIGGKHDRGSVYRILIFWRRGNDRAVRL